MDLVEQCAFYFSDSNLRRDKFLQRSVGKDGVGAVAVDTLATFNRVKQQTTDREVLLTALRAVPGLAVSEDGATVSRIRPLPSTNTSEARTVYVENLPDNPTIESLHKLFAPCGEVSYVSLPRLPNRDPKGFAFIEFGTLDGVARAIADMNGKGVGGGDAPSLRVMYRAAWAASKAEYKKALEQGKERAAADAAEQAALAAATERCTAAAAAAAEAEAEELAKRTVVKVVGLKRGNAVKAVRKELAAAFGAVATVDYVDYGISNSGDTTIAYVRMTTTVGAAEAARVLASEGAQFGGAPAAFEVLTGPPLLTYLTRIGEMRRAKAEKGRKQRSQWWDRKYGKGAAAATGGEGEGEGEGGGGGEGEGGGGGEGEGEGEGGEASQKRPRDDAGEVASEVAADGADEQPPSKMARAEGDIQP